MRELWSRCLRNEHQWKHDEHTEPARGEGVVGWNRGDYKAEEVIPAAEDDRVNEHEEVVVESRGEPLVVEAESEAAGCEQAGWNLQAENDSPEGREWVLTGGERDI